MEEHIGQIKKNGPLKRVWSKSPIKFFGSELFDMGRLRYLKQQYYFVRPKEALSECNRLSGQFSKIKKS